jgi:hypothetical protein
MVLKYPGPERQTTMVAWEQIIQIDSSTDSTILGAYGSEMRQRQPIMHRWIGALSREFSLREWITFCRTALIIWKAVESQVGALDPVSQIDLQAASRKGREGLSKLTPWPQERLARVLLPLVEEHKETDLLMFACFEYQQALRQNDRKQVRPERGCDFVLSAWIMIDAILMAVERSRASAKTDIPSQANARE